MKYSFIIPVYNGEKYLKECIDSVLGQTVKDIEIIIVDDGSKDGSGDICDEYAKNYNFVKVFHTENKGVSAARNFGIEKSEGEYICFVDCDDVISTYMAEYAEMTEGKYDVILFGYTREGVDKLCGTNIKNCGEEVNIREIRDKMIYDDWKSSKYNCGTVSKIFRRNIIGNKRFVEDIKIGEDRLFNFGVFQNAKTMGYIENVMYYCRPHSGSVMHKYSSDYDINADRTFEEFEKLIINDENKEHYTKMLTLRAVAVMNNIVILKLCHKMNKDPYAKRKAEWKSIKENSLTGKYFKLYDGNGLNSRDKFLYYVFQKSFFRIDMMTKCKAAKAFEYAVYKLFKSQK